VESALALPKVGMVVSADMADPAGAMHPIHPMWKKAIAARAALWADNVIYGNASSPASGPRVAAAVSRAGSKRRLKSEVFLSRRGRLPSVSR
jgi:hypothetical protein